MSEEFNTNDPQQDIPEASVVLDYARVGMYDSKKLIKTGKLYNWLNNLTLPAIILFIAGFVIAMPSTPSSVAPLIYVAVFRTVMLTFWLTGFIMSFLILKTLKVHPAWIILNSVAYVICCLIGGGIASHMAHRALKKNGFKPGFIGISKKQFEQMRLHQDPASDDGI